jgi:hypothetical protein
MKLKKKKQKNKIPYVCYSSMRSLLTSWSTAISELWHKKREKPSPIWKRFWMISCLSKIRLRVRATMKKSRKPSSKWEVKSLGTSKNHSALKSKSWLINSQAPPSLSTNYVTIWSQRFKNFRTPSTWITLSIPPKWTSSKINLPKLRVSALSSATSSKKRRSKVS